MSKKLKIIFWVLVFMFWGYLAWGSWQRWVRVRQLVDFESCKRVGFEIVNNTPAECRTPDGGIFFDVTDSPKVYEGKGFAFEYLPQWTPKDVTQSNGLETVSLGIPNIDTDQIIGFVAKKPVKPQGITSESEITIGGIKGNKWISKTDKAVSYDYATDNFLIHVSEPEEDPIVESQLDALAGSVIFSTPNQSQ